MEWIRDFNSANPTGGPVRIYGIDLYSLFESIDAVITAIGRVDPPLMRQLLERYECFKPYQRDEGLYTAALSNLPGGCSEEAAANLQALLGLRLGRIQLDESDLIDVQQNARLVTNAETYYRSLLISDNVAWNVRERHMIETVNSLLSRASPETNAIVWAHDSHIGDHRGSPMREQGYVSMGGLARDLWGDENVSLVGFSTFEGRLTAAPGWREAPRKTNLPPAREGSLDRQLERAGKLREVAAYTIDLENHSNEFARFERLGQRTIGCLLTDTGDNASYVETDLALRFDAMVFIRNTNPVEPVSTEHRESRVQREDSLLHPLARDENA